MENNQPQAQYKGRAPETIKLEFPVEFGKETITEIVLQPPKGIHLRKLPAQPGMDDIMKLASTLSGVSANVFNEMEAVDVNKICRTVGEWL